MKNFNTYIFLLLGLLGAGSCNSKSAEDYFRSGVYKADSLSDMKGAIDDFTKALENDPGMDSAYDKRGNAKKWLGDYKGAMADYNEAIRINPKSFSAYNNRGVTYGILGNSKDEETDYKMAVTLNPSFWRGWYNLGNCYLDATLYDSALQFYNKAITLNPAFANAWFNRACTYDEMHEYEKAADNYTKAIECKLADDKAQGEAYYSRAVDYLHLGDTTSACADFQKAKELAFPKAGEKLHEVCK